MLAETILLEYLAGTKGDFLKNILLYRNSKRITAEFNRSQKSNFSLKHLSLYELYQNSILPLTEFDNLLKAKPEKIITAHQLFFLQNNKQYFELLEKNNYVVYKICFEQKHYKTVFIESIIKNLYYDDSIKFKNKIKEENYKKQSCKDAFNFNIDFELFSLGIEINNSNRIEFLHNQLSYPICLDSYNKDFYKICKIFNSKKQNKNKKILNYQDIYLDFNLNNNIFKDIDVLWYKEQVSRNWLPLEINIFNETIKLKDYGYMNF